MALPYENREDTRDSRGLTRKREWTRNIRVISLRRVRLVIIDYDRVLRAGVQARRVLSEHWSISSEFRAILRET